MSKSAFPGSPDHAATLRRMNLLVAILVLSNVATGLMAFYLLRKVDDRYSELIGRSVPVLNDLRELMTDSVIAMRATNPREFTGANGNPAAALKTMRERLGTLQTFRAATLKGAGFDDMPADRKAIEASGEEFDRIAVELTRLYAAGNLAEAAKLREERLLPAFDRQISFVATAADVAETRALKLSNELTAKTQSVSTLVLGVAGWPVIAMVGLLLLTVCFVVVLMFVFRGKELGDMP